MDAALPAALLVLPLAEDSGGWRRWLTVGHCHPMSPAAWDLNEPAGMDTAPTDIPCAGWWAGCSCTDTS